MNKKNKSKQTGITLIALVVTIIVLLILAGISIMMLTGQNGILTKAGIAKEEVERTKVIEAAMLAYNNVKIDILGENYDEEVIANLTVDKLIQDGYDVKSIVFTSTTVTDLELSSTKVELNVGDPEFIINATYQSGNISNTKYYILVLDEYYELTITNSGITLGKTAVDISDLETESTNELSVISSDSNESIIQVTTIGNTIKINPVAEGDATISVTLGDITKIVEVMVKNNVARISSVNLYSSDDYILVGTRFFVVLDFSFEEETELTNDMFELDLSNLEQNYYLINTIIEGNKVYINLLGKEVTWGQDYVEIECYCNGGFDYYCFKVESPSPMVCQVCKDGRLDCYECDGTGYLASGEECNVCFGNGWVDCYNCGGSVLWTRYDLETQKYSNENGYSGY